MQDLPYIDQHVTSVDTSPQQVWPALLATLRTIGAGLPRPVIRAWGLEPGARRGDWDRSVAVGDSIVAFGVAGVDPPRSLTLRGRHRFSRYELRFEITDGPAGGSVLHAHTSATFPGLAGSAYRALVIGTGGHRVAVRRLLAAVARRATR
ncbi:MAG TPA: hypothetical protein VGH93_15235 [Solirubrobacteraceae bacterium]